MEKQIIFAFAIIFCLAIALAPVYGHYYSETVKPTAQVEKMTRVHFFYHDILSGTNPSAVPIARPNMTETSPFLNLIAMDDPLTIGPEPTSAVIGNAQGLTLLTSRDPTMFAAVLYADFAFTSGGFNGSSFSLFSRYPSTDFALGKEMVRELAVVGGRGAFRMARGFALIRASFVNATTGDSILEFNVTLYHY